MEALKAVGLADRADHHPNQLSGGQQQRVAIARALITKPAILLADEPTGNLDTRTSIEVMGIFQRLNVERGITVLLITHELDIAEYATRVIACRDGVIVSDHPVSNAPLRRRRAQGAAGGNRRLTHFRTRHLRTDLVSGVPRTDISTSEAPVVT